MDEQDQTHVVWVQLYIGEEKSGNTFKVLVKATGNIDDLKEAVKEKRPNDLANCDAAQLAVYNAGSKCPSEEEDPLSPCEGVPKDTTCPRPLRVVAPAGKNT
jgi:Crinkler effector protein N-terminal domain